MTFIIKYLSERPLLVKLLLLFIILIAILSTFRLKRLTYPQVDLYKVNITTEYPGASPEDVELNVTSKLEEAIKEIDWIDNYTSKSMENISLVQIKIDRDTDDKQKVIDEIQRAIDGVKDLPVEIKDKPDIDEIKVDNFPFCEVALTLPEYNQKKIFFHARELKKKLLDEGRISKVEEIGVKDREYKILLNRNKMADNYISFREVIMALKNNHLRLSCGFLESYTREKGIVTFSEFSSPQEINNIIIRTDNAGLGIVRIKDVAKVLDDFEKSNIVLRYNGLQGVSLQITKKSISDVLNAVDDIKKVIAKYKNQFKNEKLDIFFIFDDSIETRERLAIVYGNAILGFVLVIFILFFFLDSKIAFWTAAGIPISVGITLIALPFFNISINSISLCGLVVVLGMVVDDAIIISENISRAKENGMRSLEAALYGLKNVIKPVMGTIITTILAFLPMYFLPGMEGNFSREIPTIVIIMLVASFIEAITILPVHLAHTKSSQKKIKNTNKKRKRLPGKILLSKIEAHYKNILKLTLQHKIKALIILLGFLIIGTYISFSLTKFNMFPPDQAYKIFIYGETETDATLKFTAEQTREIEKIISRIPEKGVTKSYKTVVGLKFESLVDPWIQSANSFIIVLTLTPSMKRKMTAPEISDFLKTEYSKMEFKEIKSLDFYIDDGGPPIGKPIAIEITGNDNLKRKLLIQKVQNYLSKECHATETDNNYKKGKSEVKLLPNYELVARSGLSVAAIASTIRTAIDGSIAAHFNTPEERIPFRVILDKKSKNYKNPLQGLLIRNQYGVLTPIENLVHQKNSFSPQNIFHYNGERTNKITGNVNRKKTTPKEVFDKLKAKYKNFEKENPGFKLNIGGRAQASAQMYWYLIGASLVAIIAIFFILVIQFNSFIQPIMVIMAIPFGLVGLLLAFALHGMDLSMFAMLGVIGFSGVIVNDSLIMVEFINRLLKEKNDQNKNKITLVDAIIEGARTRLRPILLTTITTMAGLIPTAYGIIGGFDFFISPMVMAMAWGLFTGTLATLIAIPIFYVNIQSVVDYFKHKYLKICCFLGIKN